MTVYFRYACRHTFCETCIESRRLEQLRRYVFTDRFIGMILAGPCPSCGKPSDRPETDQDLKQRAREVALRYNIEIEERGSKFLWSVNDFKQQAGLCVVRTNSQY